MLALVGYRLRENDASGKHLLPARPPDTTDKMEGEPPREIQDSPDRREIEPEPVEDQAREALRAAQGDPSSLALEGVILDNDSKGLPDARVSSLRNPDLSAEADDLGRFRLLREPSRESEDLLVVCDGFAPEIATCYPGRSLICRLTRGIVQRGRVLLVDASGQRAPLSRKQITARRLDSLRQRIETQTTGDDGSFEFCDIRNKPILIVVPLEGRAPWIEQITVTGDDHDIVIPGAVVTVNVIALDAVRGVALPETVVTCEGQYLGTTDSSGHVAIKVGALQKCDIRASHDGFCDQTKFVDPTVLGLSGSLRVELHPAAILYGIVTDEGDVPLEGAEVRMSVSSAWGKPVAAGIVGAEPGTGVRTTQSGEFRFAGIGSRYGSSQVRLTVRLSGFATYETDEINVLNGATVGPIRCILPQGSEISGTVSVNGLGVKATVFLKGARKRIHTSDDGKYKVLGVSPGLKTLCAYLDEHQGVKACTSVVVDAEGATHLDIPLDYILESIVGTVSTRLGVPLANVLVYCEGSTFDEDPVVYSARTNDDGMYSLEVPLSPGEIQEYAVRLKRWEEDCVTQVQGPPAVANLECADSGMIMLEASTDGRSLASNEMEFVWYSNGDRAKDSVCMDKQQVNNVRVMVAVPSGTGELEVQYDEARWIGSVQVISGAVTGIGQIELKVPEAK